MKRSFVRIGLALLLVLWVAAPASAGEWRYPFGLTYTSGFSDVLDYYEDVLGVDADLSFPIGISFAPYFEFDQGHRLGLDVGPPSIILVEITAGSSSENIDYFNLPLGGTYGYTFLRDKSVTPYFRAGFRYNLVSGDLVDSSSPGFLGAIGFETHRKKRVGFSFEIAYDNATVDFVDEIGFQRSTEEIEVGGLQVSFRVIFY